jgi:hypothetical protein
MASGPRKGKMKSSPKAKVVADLRQISPGVLVGPKYKPGKDPAMDAVIEKLKNNPGGLDSSGMGNRWKV